MMPMDAYRYGYTFVVRLDVPGIHPGSIDLTVERNVLTVHAERTRPDPQAERIAAEVSHGLFSRQLFLGDSLDVDHLTADYTDGVLTLRLPVAERAKPRRIEVQHTGGTRSVEAATS
jgi:HSP20 family protein